MTITAENPKEVHRLLQLSGLMLDELTTEFDTCHFAHSVYSSSVAPTTTGKGQRKR